MGRTFGLAAAGIATITLAAAPLPTMAEDTTDTKLPQVTLVSPTEGPQDDLQIQVEASDNEGLAFVVANLRDSDNNFVKSTQSHPAGARTYTHEASIGGLKNGVYQLKYGARDVAGNSARTGVFYVTIDDTVKPQTNLVTPTTSGPFQKLTIQVKASDNNGLNKIVANVYKDGTLAKSTQSAVSGYTAIHNATVSLPDGDYLVRYNASDLAGNVSTTRHYPVTLDSTAPTVTIKEGAPYTVYHGGPVSGSYNVASFTVSDAVGIDRVELNGVELDVPAGTVADVDFVKLDHGAVPGENTLVVYDTAGNITTHTFNIK